MKTNKELIDKLKQGHIAIDNTGNPNVELLRAVLKEAFPDDNSTINGISTYYYTIMKGFNWINGENYKKLPTITLNDFLEKEQFPKDDFGVIVENSNGKEIIDYLHNKGFIKTGWDGSGTLYNYGVRKDSKDIIYTSSNAFSKTYTLQQLKNLENNMENKEIIGYKLKKDCEQYRKACKDIKFVYDGKESNYLEERTNIWQGIEDKQLQLALEKAGVWNLWFEPVYKSKEIVIRMGDKFDLTVKDGKIWHKSDNITQFVQNLVNCFDYVNKDQSYGQYKAQFKDVIFSFTGCEKTETKLSEWILVYNELQKQK